MVISTGKGDFLGSTRQSVLAGRALSAPIGSSTPTAAQSSVAGIFQSPGTPNYRSHIRRAFIRTGAAMDVSMGFTAFNYLSSSFAPINLLYTGNTFNATPFTGANAAPNVNVIQTFPSVPTTGLLIENIDVVLTPSVYFVFYGLTVNTALYGFIWWDEIPLI